MALSIPMQINVIFLCEFLPLTQVPELFSKLKVFLLQNPEFINRGYGVMAKNNKKMYGRVNTKKAKMNHCQIDLGLNYKVNKQEEGSTK